jgi:hypothetical protein
VSSEDFSGEFEIISLYVGRRHPGNARWMVGS